MIPVSHGHLDLIPIQAASTSGLQLWQQTHGFSPVANDTIREPNRITHRFTSIFFNTWRLTFPMCCALIVCVIPHLWDLPRLFNPQRCLLTPSECDLCDLRCASMFVCQWLLAARAARVWHCDHQFQNLENDMIFRTHVKAHQGQEMYKVGTWY